MRKLILLVLCILTCNAVSANAQLSRLQTREAEWKSYSLPQTNFARHLDPDKNLIFRVPADWQQVSALGFSGPHTAVIAATVQEIPDGYPLQDFFGSVVRYVRNNPAAAESMVTRQTELQDLEARELFYEELDEEGELVRHTIWVTVSGPLAISFNFRAPIAHAAELEPFFKAVVQSVILVPSNYSAFETLRSAAIKTPTPGPIHELESLVTSLNKVTADRRPVITRLGELFKSNADVALDLLLDRRPLIRVAAVEALAHAGNDVLALFLWQMLNDREPLVAEAAGRAVANMPDVVNKTIHHSLFGLQIEKIARVWPFLARDKQIELLQRFFSQTAVGSSPPPEKASLSKGKVLVSVLSAEPVAPEGQTRNPTVHASLSNDAHIQMSALPFLLDVPREEFKLPLARIMASNHDPLITVALQVANIRGESLPVDALFKLVASSDQTVSKLAAQNLGVSAAVSDIPRIEALISKDATADEKSFDEELKLSIKKIRFRHDLAATKSASQQSEIIAKALSDSSLTTFAWLYSCEATNPGCNSPTKTALPSDFTVKPFAENLFPNKIQHFAAIPKPGEAVQNFYQTLQGLQMDSPRAQSDLVLTLGFRRQQLARELSAPADAEALIDYSGVDPDSPIVVAAWTPASIADRTSNVTRQAIVLRVKDRARFERTVERLQETNSNFLYVTDVIALGSRAMAAFPAILPLSAKLALDPEISKAAGAPKFKYSFVGEKEWNGLKIKTFEQRHFNSSWLLEGASTHLTFLGDTAIITPDVATLRELLENQDGRQYLADSAEFKNAIQRVGDVVYFSDVKSVMADAFQTSETPVHRFDESGVLRFSSASWENSHYFAFDESDWAKPLHSFDPKELSAPRDLLPASTIAYYFMKLDPARIWESELKNLLPANTDWLVNLWALDFNREVLPELGPECGAVMLDLPKTLSFTGSTWAVFCKLKSNKLVEGLKQGTLFRGVGPTGDIAEIKVGDDSYFVATRSGFLVVSNQSKAFTAFDGKTSLASTRDYSRAVEKVPDGIVAFGGYNLEAAVTAANGAGGDGEKARIANLILSLARAFHSQNFYATATGGTLEARSSVAMDREGRYPVADLSYVPHGANITLVTIEPRGVPLTDQKRLTSLTMKIRAKAPGPIDNIKDDMKTADQIVEQKGANELLLTVAARRFNAEKAVELPVNDPALAEYLKATSEFPANHEEVKNKAREIAGNDKDAWSVARKLADWTYENLEWKHVTNADAARTLATREADCSEFSQLFVAMARSLGLPARMVSGLAHGGASFGGHAWVEVWAGRWIELDPTWGTHFVDATHIRSTSNALLTTAALNLIELEVVETKRSVADFQKTARALAEHLVRVIPREEESEIEATIDLPALTDDFMGAGAWARMNDGEREQLWTAYRRIIYEITDSYGKAKSFGSGMSLLHLQEKGDEAEAICLRPFDKFLKLLLVRRNDVWYLAEILQADTQFHLFSETLGQVIGRIEKARAGEKLPPASLSDFTRALLLTEKNPLKALEVIDNALTVKPADKSLRLLKARALLKKEDGKEDALKLLQELSDGGFVPAVFQLAKHLHYAEEGKEIKKAIELYERYTTLEPYDSRALTWLAPAYDKVDECEKAEAAYRKAIDIEPGETDHYLDLVEFLAYHDRFDEIKPVLEDADKYREPNEDLFGIAVENLYDEGESELAGKVAKSDPSRLKTSYLANLTLGRINLENGRYVTALRFLNVAARLEAKETYPHIVMARVYRKQMRWTAALNAAQRAIDLDPAESEGYYQRACALARMGRLKDAMSSLEKAVEIDSYQAEWMVEEKDLRPLRSLPAFKKLLPKPESQ